MTIFSIVKKAITNPYLLKPSFIEIIFIYDFYEADEDAPRYRQRRR